LWWPTVPKKKTEIFDKNAGLSVIFKFFKAAQLLQKVNK